MLDIYICIEKEGGGYIVGILFEPRSPLRYDISIYIGGGIYMYIFREAPSRMLDIYIELEVRGRYRYSV